MVSGCSPLPVQSRKLSGPQHSFKPAPEHRFTLSLIQNVGMLLALRNVARKVPSSGGADMSTSEFERRRPSRASLPPAAVRGRLGTAEASGRSDSRDAPDTAAMPGPC